MTSENDTQKDIKVAVITALVVSAVSGLVTWFITTAGCVLDDLDRQRIADLVTADAAFQQLVVDRLYEEHENALAALQADIAETRKAVREVTNLTVTESGGLLLKGDFTVEGKVSMDDLERRIYADMARLVVVVDNAPDNYGGAGGQTALHRWANKQGYVSAFWTGEIAPTGKIAILVMPKELAAKAN